MTLILNKPAAERLRRYASAWLRHSPRLIAAVAVLAYVVAADCASLAYELGRQTGAAVHSRNDQLASLVVRLTVPPTAPEPALAAPAVAPVPAAPSRSQRIRAMRATGATQAAIAAAVGCSRSTVRRTLAACAA